MTGLITGLFFGAVSALLAAWSLDLLGSTYHSVEEAKICYSALTDSDHPLQPQTREFLKGRLYWNAARWISPSWLEDWHIDFGPVETAKLEGLPFAKDAVSADEVYRSALAKHPKAATNLYTW
ncbi:MAG: hypothetical protein IPK22_18395 [Verrucomicrobiaceae bacterium]|nr:hypothetical protein [Verrucomicrobiaceae bacterium]